MDYKSISLFSMESSSRWKIGKKTEKKKPTVSVSTLMLGLESWLSRKCKSEFFWSEH